MNILRSFKKCALFLFLSLMMIFAAKMTFYPGIKKSFSNVTYMKSNITYTKNSVTYMTVQQKKDNENKTFLLTINHDIGRLGNIMFKYASLLGIAEKENRKPFVLKYKEDFNLEKLFKLTHVDHKMQSIPNSWPTISETQYAYYDPVFTKLPPKDLRLSGYVQCWKYFQNVEAYLRKEFSLTDTMKKEAQTVLSEVRQKWAGNKTAVFIGVHVRSLDKLSTKNTTVSPKSFYLNSFEKMRTLIPGQHLIFVVSGNNLDWCEKNLAGDNVTVLRPASPSIHFAVLSSCQHFILSTGTFGWWAGWLTDGHVIFYKKFPLPRTYEANGFHYEDYYPPSWIPIDD